MPSLSHVHVLNKSNPIHQSFLMIKSSEKNHFETLKVLESSKYMYLAEKWEEFQLSIALRMK